VTEDCPDFIDALHALGARIELVDEHARPES
jgi:hypothetical protein